LNIDTIQKLLQVKLTRRLVEDLDELVFFVIAYEELDHHQNEQLALLHRELFVVDLAAEEDDVLGPLQLGVEIQHEVGRCGVPVCLVLDQRRERKLRPVVLKVVHFDALAFGQGKDELWYKGWFTKGQNKNKNTIAPEGIYWHARGA